MPDWELLITEHALASVFPDAYARYVRPIRAALLVFLQGLPAAHQAEILERQASLPPAATFSQRLGLLARSCPALHKLGQVLARDRRLPAGFRVQLQQLESLPSTLSWAAIRDLLTRELGPLERLGVTLAPPALAEASVAVVVPFRHRGHAGEHRPPHGVFKILKPNIQQRLELELELLQQVGSHLDQRCDDFRIPHLDYQEVIQQVGDRLRHETRLDLEQRHLVAARAVYRGDPQVQIPELFEHCTPRVTAMERVVGHKVTEHRLKSPSRQRWLAGVVIGALIARPVFSKAGGALFHGDPHAGNLMFTEDRRLAILDWSLVGSLAEKERVAIAQITLGALTLDSDRIVAAIASLAQRPTVDRTALRAIVRAGLRRVRCGHFPGLIWQIDMLDEAVKNARLRVGADLMLFRKTLHSLQGVIGDLGALEQRIDDALSREFLHHLFGEWPRRLLAPADSRAFATRLSNVDLAQLVVSLPWTAFQLWPPSP